MKVTRPSGVTGSLFGSIFGLLVVLVAGVVALVSLLVAMFGYPWETVIAGAIGAAIGAFILRANSTLIVSQDGLFLYQLGKVVCIPWENVERIQEGRLGASLIFNQRQPIGLKPKSKFMFDGLDVSWRTRPTTVAINRQLSRSRSTSS